MSLRRLVVITPQETPSQRESKRAAVGFTSTVVVLPKYSREVSRDSSRNLSLHRRLRTPESSQLHGNPQHKHVTKAPCGQPATGPMRESVYVSPRYPQNHGFCRILHAAPNASRLSHPTCADLRSQAALDTIESIASQWAELLQVHDSPMFQQAPTVSVAAG